MKVDLPLPQHYGLIRPAQPTSLEVSAESGAICPSLTPPLYPWSYPYLLQMLQVLSSAFQAEKETHSPHLRQEPFVFAAVFHPAFRRWV